MAEKKTRQDKEEIVIDATNATFGRLASYAAKKALQGNKIVILNSEKAIVTGRKMATLEKYQQRRARGGTSQRGPFFPRLPEMILKRAIGGMLPDYKRGRGKEAFRKIMCYRGTPDKYKEAKSIKAGKEKNTNYMSIEQISNRL